MSLEATGPAKGRKLVTGVIGADTHIDPLAHVVSDFFFFGL